MAGLIIKRFAAMYGVLLVGEVMSSFLNVFLYKYYPISSIRPIYFGSASHFLARSEFLLANYGFLIWNIMSGFAIMALSLPVIQYFVRKKLLIWMVLIALQVLFFVLISKSDSRVAFLVGAGAAPALLMFFVSMELDSRISGGKRIGELRAGA